MRRALRIFGGEADSSSGYRRFRNDNAKSNAEILTRKMMRVRMTRLFLWITGNLFLGQGVGAMIKKKGKKSKATANKVVRKKKVSRSKKEKNTAELRKDLVNMVKENAPELVEAVVEEGAKGQVSPVKFLLELAGIFPVPEAEVNAPDKREESLAETLLDRLGIPKTPVVADEYEKGVEEIVLHPVGAKKEEESVEEKELVTV